MSLGIESYCKEFLEQELSLVCLSVLPHGESGTCNSAGDERGLCAGFSSEFTNCMGRTFLSQEQDTASCSV